MNAIMKGHAWKFGDHIDTDVIIPARYLVSGDAAELGKHCMEDADPAFVSKISKGDVIVGGENFGCGSSREHAPLAILGSGVSCVIAASFARISSATRSTWGLPIFECLEAAANIAVLGDDVSLVNAAEGFIFDKTTNRRFAIVPFSPFLQELIDKGGLVPYVRSELEKRRDERKQTIRRRMPPGGRHRPEVIAETRKVIEAAASRHAFGVEWTTTSFGAGHYLKTGEILPDSAVDEMAGCDRAATRGRRRPARASGNPRTGNPEPTCDSTSTSTSTCAPRRATRAFRCRSGPGAAGS